MDSIPAFKEAVHTEFVSPVKGKEGKEWDVVLIAVGWSKNDKYYSRDVLKASVPLFEGAKACMYRFGDSLDHLSDDAEQRRPSGFSLNTIGWYAGIHFGSYKDSSGNQREGVLGRLHVAEGMKTIRENLRDAWLGGKMDIYQLSIDAQGEAVEGEAEGKTGLIVQKIENVNSTDVVSEGAAGGEFIRLAASVKGEPMKKIYSLLQESLPHFLEGMPALTDQTDMGEYLAQTFERNIPRAEEEQANIGLKDERALQEAARGVNTLRKLVELVSQGRAGEALKIIQNWVSRRPAVIRVTEGAKASFYLFPSKTKEAATSPESEGTTMADENTTEEVVVDPKDGELKIRENVIRVKEMVLESGLPAKARDRVIKMFSSHSGDLTDEQIEQAIVEEREYIASFTESGTHTELGDANEDKAAKTDIKVVRESYDKVLDAWNGFFNGDGLPVNGVEPFYSLHEAYARIENPQRFMTPMEVSFNIFRAIRAAFPGDEFTKMADHRKSLQENWGAHARAHGLKESVTSSTFSTSFSDVINQQLQKEYTAEGRNDWGPVVSTRENAKDFTNSIRVNRVGGFNDLPVVAEGAPYQEITPTQTENTESITPQKRGGLEKLTMEAVLADQVGVIRRIPRSLAVAESRTVSKDIWNQIESNPNTADAVALIATAHLNLVSGSPALTAASLADAIQLLRDQTEQDSGEKIGLRPAWLIVGTKLEDLAFELVNSDVKATPGEDSTVVNFVRSKGIKVISTLGVGRSASTDDHWWLTANTRDTEAIVAAFLGGKMTPDIFVQSPSDTPTAGEAFTADKMIFKIRSNYVGSTNSDHRYIVGSLA